LFRVPSAMPPPRISAIISDHSSRSSRPRWPVDSSLSSCNTLVTRSGSEMRALTIVASSSSSSVRVGLSPARGRSRGAAASSSGKGASKLSSGNPTASIRRLGSAPSTTHAGNRVHPAAIATATMKRCILKFVTLSVCRSQSCGCACLARVQSFVGACSAFLFGSRLLVQLCVHMYTAVDLYPRIRI
jgi:hypothetical protein